ncbi:tRNA lysidine(34) synthetase TilS [Paenibacillus sp. IHBB 10380]|uniref:tRNA lysidine(34) synthetase TilS n=1 Tax=Paenibacillus sp. IHBB 10380 TaxID=1566358 RepID=UPI0005CFEDEF|nr:tRNA lysidine(34) synthetase TilS [Paenibacillus sp. IHBB 10380]AJS60748.1 tRNA(Ile)-lysidine synthetase [Paenibacillus sp. IHBB 10380]
MRMNLLVEHVLRTAQEKDLWSAHDTIIVAVSGGPDSVALLHVMHEVSQHHTPLNLVCAHVHHGFRAESDEESELVRAAAKELNIPFEMESLDIPAYMKQSGKGPEEAARDKRYEFLFKKAEAYGAKSIAVGHHADDQAETVLLHLLRGSGPSGLSGMKFKRSLKNVELIRPLLRIYKTDLVEVCKNGGYAYAIDNSNLQTEYRRNAIRLNVLPYLGQYNGQITQSLNQLSSIVAGEDDYVELAAEEAYRELVQQKDGRFTVAVPSFLGLHVALQRRLIKLILNYMSVNSEITDFSKVESIRQGFVQIHATTWSRDLGGGITCIREYDVVTFMPQPLEKRLSYTYRLDTVVQELRVNEIGKVLRMISRPRGDSAILKEEIQGHEALFDADQLVFPLTLRSRQDGDTMKVMGLGGSKKVKDLLIDEKIPPSMRQCIPMIVDGCNNMLWIPGIRRSIHAAIGSQTTSVLHMSLEEIVVEQSP